jgi:hypothetical protein
MNRLRPVGKVVRGFVNRIIGKGVEVVLAVNQSIKTFREDLEERVERFEDCVLGLGIMCFLNYSL